jgi:protein tyrosine kinase modulator
MLGHRELTIDDYLEIFRRRWLSVLVPAILGPALAYAVSLQLPSRYTSQTLVLVEGQTVPDTFVKPVITKDWDARMGTIQEQILSRTRLQPIIERFALFGREAVREPMEDLVDRMRKAIAVTPVKSMVSTREGNMPGFYVAVTLDNPRTAQQVCTEITSMFIDENLRQREQSARGTTNFLQSQLQDAKRNLDEQDAKLAEFKRKYMGSLPDETQTNLNLLNTLSAQLEVVTQSLNRAQVDKAYAESLLVQQTAAWESVKHGTTPRPETLEQQLTAMENELVALQARYTSGHPDVIKLKTAIAELKEKARRSPKPTKEPSAERDQEVSITEPPEIQQLRSQLRSHEEAIRGYIRQQLQLQQQIKLYESRVQLSPVVEQQYRETIRDYQTALDFYNELLRKKDQSEMATDLERRQQGEQFRVMDPANLPEKPSFPNRPLFAGAGLGGGLALGIALVLLLEMRDKALRTERDIEFFLKLPTLAMVSSIGHAKRRVWRDRLRKRAARPAHPLEA